MFLAVALANCSASGTPSGSGGAGGSGTGGIGSGGTGAGGSGGSGATTAGGGKVGDACATNADCSDPVGAECFSTIGNAQVGTLTFPAGYCSKACSNEGGDECGTSGSCTSLSSSGGNLSTTLTMCTAPCKVNEDCRTADGYHCQIVIPGFGFCAP